VHDAARPCVSQSDIEALLTAVKHHAVGGLLAATVVDTLKKVDSSMGVQTTIDRDTVYRAQTPQVFRYELLLQALTKARSGKEAVTDESSAIERLGLTPLIVVGNANNIKLTYAADLQQAEASLIARE